MARLKPLDIDAYQKNQARVAQLVAIAETSHDPTKAINALIVRHLNGDIPTPYIFKEYIKRGEFPMAFKAWTAIERLMAHHGFNIKFDKHKETTWIHRNHHPLHPANGFPFRRDLKLTMKMVNWINCHPCIIQPVNQVMLISLIQANDSPFVKE